MKIGRILISVVLLVALGQIAMAETPEANATAPKYDVKNEVTLKGTITEISERNCPISGSMGFHFTLKTADGNTIEVHVATSKFVKDYDVTLNKDDQVEVIGSKVKFQGADTIMAREVTRGTDVFVFRFKDGKPAW
jgi:hypothetical protein